MRNVASLPNFERPHVVRLNNLVQLSPVEAEALASAGRRTSSYPARREIVHVGETFSDPMILIEGWAAHVRDFRDGRRQILHLVLPGDLISVVRRPGAQAITIVALTDALLATAPVAEDTDSGLGLAYDMSADIETACLQRQIARIGRLDAYERLADLFLELADRLDLAGLSAADGFALPLTQEMLADCLGLTSVHVNRTLQQMRREGMIDDQRRTISLLDPGRLRSLVDYRPLIRRV